MHSGACRAGQRAHRDARHRCIPGGEIKHTLVATEPDSQSLDRNHLPPLAVAVAGHIAAEVAAVASAASASAAPAAPAVMTAGPRSTQPARSYHCGIADVGSQGSAVGSLKLNKNVDTGERDKHERKKTNNTN